MKFLLIYSAWLMLSGIVALAASRLGRSASAWFLLAIIILPLLAGGVLAFTSRDKSRGSRRREAAREPDFEPDGVYAGIPYKVADNAVIVAQMPQGTVRFPTMEQFLAAASARIA